MILPPGLLEGRTPPILPIESYDNIQWYQEQIRRCFEGYEVNGTRFTGDYYFYLNFFPIILLKKDKFGNIMNEVDFTMPYFSQQDDYLFKQIEEADQDSKFPMLFTGRGYGKTYAMLSIAAKYYYFMKNAHCMISASLSDHADASFGKLKLALDGIDQNHPTIRHNRLYDTMDLVESGTQNMINNEKQITGNRSILEKVVYDKKAGKTRGTRPTYQLFEEIGSWSGAAKLKDCYAGSLGSWKRGSIYTCRVMFIGTGGEMKSGGSEDARDMFWNPEAFNLYQTKDWAKPSAIFIPSYLKYGGFWEKDGISDVEGAKAHLDKEREDKKSDPNAYYKLIQEYPYTPDECFLTEGSNIFNQQKLANQYVNILNKPEYQLGERGNLHFIRHNNKITGVEWEKNVNGKIIIFEHPEKDTDGNGFNNLYIAGFDGFDVDKLQAASDKRLSNGSIAVKKRFLSISKTYNWYVCTYADRPNTAEEFFENSLKILMYYDCKCNPEYSKIGFIGYVKDRKQFHRFVERPKMCRTDPNDMRFSTLIGTPATPKVFEYGELAVAKYIEEYCHLIYDIELIAELRDYTPESRTKFDRVVSMIMAEIADDDIMDTQVKSRTQPTIDHWGFYTGENGKKKYGVIPSKVNNEELFGSSLKIPDYRDMVNKQNIY